MLDPLSRLEAIRERPTEAGSLDRVREIAAAHRRDPEVSRVACRAALAIADLRAFDEPRLDAQGPEHLVLELTEGATDVPSLRARANALGLLRRDDEAVATFERALVLAPDDAPTLFDLSLFAKRRARFRECLDATQRALACASSRALQFHLAIAATALGRGELALAAYRALGLPVRLTNGGMPMIEGLPPAFVRVAARGSGVGSDRDRAIPDRAIGFEVIEVAPISPCHGVIAGAAFRDGPVDHGDVVLWDAAPVEMLRSPTGEVSPLFPLLACLRAGTERRFRFAALEQRIGDAAALEAELPEGCRVFVQREHAEHVCPRCANGEVLQKHDHERDLVHVVYGKLIAAESVSLTELRDRIERFVRAHGRVSLSIPALYEALGDAKRAGAEHQAFLGVERAVLRGSR